MVQLQKLWRRKREDKPPTTDVESPEKDTPREGDRRPKLDDLLKDPTAVVKKKKRGQSEDPDAEDRVKAGVLHHVVRGSYTGGDDGPWKGLCALMRYSDAVLVWDAVRSCRRAVWSLRCTDHLLPRSCCKVRSWPVLTTLASSCTPAVVALVISHHAGLRWRTDWTLYVCHLQHVGPAEGATAAGD